MAGSKIDDTLENVYAMIDGALDKNDTVTVILFNERTVRICDHTLVRDLDKGRISGAALAATALAANGETALYDAVLEALASMKKVKDNAASYGLTVGEFGKRFVHQDQLVLWHLVVFTGGKDRVSTARFADMISGPDTISGLEHPGVANFNCTVITLGVKETVRKRFDDAFRDIGHCKLLWEDGSADYDIVMGFEQHLQDIKKITLKREARHNIITRHCQPRNSEGLGSNSARQRSKSAPRR